MVKDFAQRWAGILAALVSLTLLGGCGPARDDAARTWAEIEQSAATITTDAKRFAPESYQRYDGQLAALKSALKGGQYAEVVDSSAKLRLALDEARTSAAAGKASFEAEQSKLQQRWDKLDGELSSVQSALEKRLRMLADSKQLPQNFDRARLERVGAGFARQSKSHREAQALAKAGDLSQALLRGAQIEAGYMALMREVGLAPAE